MIENGANTKEVEIDMKGEIVVGKFVDINRPTLNQAMDLQLQQGLAGRIPANREATHRSEIAATIAGGH